MCYSCVCKTFVDQNITYPVVTTPKLICPVPHLVGNDECNPEAQNEACNFDDRDCRKSMIN